MGKLGKILAPIAAVLAIALAVLSILINNGFQKYQKRAANLAETVEKTAKQLDTGTNSGLTSGLNYTAPAPGVKESGSISYADYKSDPAAFEKNTGNVVKLAGQVIDQRDELGSAIVAMTQALGLSAGNISQEQIITLESYADLLTLAKSYAEAFKKHDEEVVRALQESARLVGANNAANAAGRLPVVRETQTQGEGEEQKTVQTAVYDSQARQLGQLKANLEVLIKRRVAYETAIKNLQRVLTAHKLKANVAAIGGSGYENILKALAADMMAINAKLKELDSVKKTLRKTQAELEDARSKIAELEKEKEKLIADLKSANDRLEYYGIGAGKKPDITDKSQINPDTKGKVIIENQDWNFVIADLGKKEIIAGIEVIITDGKNYLATGTIKKVEEEICLIELTMRKASSIPRDSIVIMGRELNSKAE